MTKVKSLGHLMELCSRGNTEYFIHLGLCRSSKHIEYTDNIWYIYNEIDDTEDTFTDDELMNNKYTNIGDAIKKGAFYCYD